MKDIIPEYGLIETPTECISNLTEHTQIYCPVCHRHNGVGLSGWKGSILFILKFGCKFCGVQMEYHRSTSEARPWALGAYRDEFFAEAMREFVTVAAGKEPSKNIYLLIYPKDASKIGHQLRLVWDIDKGGETIEENEEGAKNSFQETEDESA